jgi:hypothetical protein
MIMTTGLCKSLKIFLAPNPEGRFDREFKDYWIFGGCSRSRSAPGMSIRPGLRGGITARVCSGPSSNTVEEIWSSMGTIIGRQPGILAVTFGFAEI